MGRWQGACTIPPPFLTVLCACQPLPAHLLPCWPPACAALLLAALLHLASSFLLAVDQPSAPLSAITAPASSAPPTFPTPVSLATPAAGRWAGEATSAHHSAAPEPAPLNASTLQLPDGRGRSRHPTFYCAFPCPSNASNLQLPDGREATSIHVEARIQPPSPGQGLWAAFWLAPVDTAGYGLWPSSGEVGG